MFTRVCGALVVVMAVAACDSSPSPILDSGTVADSTPPAPPDSKNPNDIYKLVIVGSAQIQVQAGQQTPLNVRYIKNEESLINETVSFAFVGSPLGTTLSTYAATTNNLGVAMTTLWAGPQPATFKVEATAAGAQPVRWDVVVVKPVEPPPPAVQLAGTLTLTSNFDVQTEFEGTQLASLLNILNEISNHPDDPGKFVVDLVFDSLDASVQSVVNLFRPILYPQVNKLLTSIAPNLIAEVKKLAQDLSGLARKFQVTSSMVSAAPQPGTAAMTVTHRLEGIGWTISGKQVAFSFAQLTMQSPVASNVKLTLGSTGSDLSIASHSFDVKLGLFLLAGLNTLVIPQINSSATNTAGLLATWIDCTSVGASIYSTVKLFGEAFWKAACDGALVTMGKAFEAEVIKVDLDPANLTLTGTCTLTDDNKDLYYDKMSGGLWVGTYTLGKSVAAVTGSANNFTGLRTK